MHLVSSSVAKNARSSGVAVCEVNSGLRDDGLDIRGFVVDLRNDRGVVVLGNTGIWDSVVEIRDCRVGARNNMNNVRVI